MPEYIPKAQIPYNLIQMLAQLQSQYKAPEAQALDALSQIATMYGNIKLKQAELAAKRPQPKQEKVTTLVDDKGAKIAEYPGDVKILKGEDEKGEETIYVYNPAKNKVLKSFKGKNIKVQVVGKTQEELATKGTEKWENPLIKAFNATPYGKKVLQDLYEKGKITDENKAFLKELQLLTNEDTSGILGWLKRLIGKDETFNLELFTRALKAQSPEEFNAIMPDFNPIGLNQVLQKYSPNITNEPTVTNKNEIEAW